MEARRELPRVPPWTTNACLGTARPCSSGGRLAEEASVRTGVGDKARAPGSRPQGEPAKCCLRPLLPVVEREWRASRLAPLIERLQRTDLPGHLLAVASTADQRAKCPGGCSA